VKYQLSTKQAECFERLQSDGVQYVLYGGAAGGGKSVVGCVWQIARRFEHPKSTGLIIRQTRKDIYSTVMVTFHKVAEQIFKGYETPYKVNEQKDEIQFSNGSKIYLREGRFMPQDPQYDRLKLEVMDAWIEEGTQVDERAFIAIRPRIREHHGGSQAKILITSNPGQGWLKSLYIKDKEGRTVNLQKPYSFIQAKVMDNPDKQFAVNYAAALSDLDPITKAMYLDGNWDVSLNENPFFYALNRQLHTGQVLRISPTHYVDLSFDFNHTPTTLIVGQLSDSACIIDHISTDPNSVTGMTPIEAACEIFRRRYIATGLIRMEQVRVTGDASGMQRKADRRADENFFADIVKALGIRRNALKVPKANPLHRQSYEMLNYIMANLQNGEFVIDNTLSMLISEIESAFPDEKLSLDKAKKELGLHGVDAWRYLLHLWFDQRKYKEQVLYLKSLKR
jgi:phage terminase large subunit